MCPCGQECRLQFGHIHLLSIVRVIHQQVPVSAPSRWDLVHALKELCDVITTKVGRLLRESFFVSICADAWTSAGRHVRAITTGAPGLKIYMNSYANLGAGDAVSGAEAVAACILTSLGLKEGSDADPSKVAVLTSDTTAMVSAMARQLREMPLCKGSLLS
jgi:hypothetical protein